MEMTNAVPITKQSTDKLKQLKLEYKRATGLAITNQAIVNKLIIKAKIEEII